MKLTMKKARILADLTRREVAEKIGVTERTISNWETGCSKPNIAELYFFCKLCAVKMQDVRL